MYILRGRRSQFPKYDIFMSVKIVFASANRVGPGKMLRFVAFHWGLPRLPKYKCMVFTEYKGFKLGVCFYFSFFFSRGGGGGGGGGKLRRTAFRSMDIFLILV